MSFQNVRKASQEKAQGLLLPSLQSPQPSVSVSSSVSVANSAPTADKTSLMDFLGQFDKDRSDYHDKVSSASQDEEVEESEPEEQNEKSEAKTDESAIAAHPIEPEPEPSKQKSETATEKAFDTENMPKEQEPVDDETSVSLEHITSTSYGEGQELNDTSDLEQEEEELKASEKAEFLKPKKQDDKKLPTDYPNPPTTNKKSVVFDFQKFLTMFKNKQCEPIHKYLRSFLTQFSQRTWTVDEQVKLIKDFEAFLYDKLLQYYPFNTLQDELELDNCKEGLEKLVLTRLYSQVFAPATPKPKQSPQQREDLQKDRKYHTSLKLYDWISPRHLDIPVSLGLESNFVKLASGEINKINNYKSPRDKIICILNCCKIIFGLIRQQQKMHQIEENADSFVPLLIYVLLQAKPKYLYSNLQYIERFRLEEFLVGETSYYVSTLEIACNFIIDLDRDKLTIEDEEFDEQLALAKQRLEKQKEEKKQKNEQKAGNDILSPIPKKLTELIGSNSNESPSQVLTKSAEMMKQSISSSFNNLFQTSPSPSETPAKQELIDIKKLSLEEHEYQETMRKQREETTDALVSMFPNLDRELITDVVASKARTEGGGNIGDCVDALLELSH
ncbi:hypothetical protein KL909_000992 [Ogataea angusta]|nr:hypothetical protein KL909_000992 [Ogataea angusta]